MSKIKRKIYKKISPFVGKILDTLFLTNFTRRGLDYYHNYNQNDYKFDKNLFCLIHIPRTGGGTIWTYFGNNANKLRYIEKNKRIILLDLIKNQYGKHLNNGNWK